MTLNKTATTFPKRRAELVQAGPSPRLVWVTDRSFKTKESLFTLKHSLVEHLSSSDFTELWHTSDGKLFGQDPDQEVCSTAGPADRLQTAPLQVSVTVRCSVAGPREQANINK